LSTCSGDDGECPKPAARAGLCWGHMKRLQRGQAVAPALTERPKSKLERLTEAALTYAEAESDEEFERAAENLRKSAELFGAATASRVSELTRVEFARRGGQARASKLSEARRREIAVSAATARWKKAKG
jgi:hypothetical protein